MTYAIVKNNEIEQAGELSSLFPNVSFPLAGPEPEWLEGNGVVPVTYFIPYDNATHKLVYVEPYIEDDNVFAVEVEPLTADEIAARDESQWVKVRADRNKRLADCDWTQLPDAPVDAAAWVAYRQELRDITTQTDPFNITWPQEPE